MGAERHPEVVRRLTAGDAAAWGEFLEAYSPLLLQVVRRYEWDEDRVADCFLFVCEGLHRRRFRRLRRYRPYGPASFATWLRAVARNLCLDWRRARFGRLLPPPSVARLPALEREAFRLLYRQGFTLDETLGSLAILFPATSRMQLLGALDRVERRYGSPRLWRRRSRPVLVSLTPAAEGPGEGHRPEEADQQPGPDEVAGRLEAARRVRRALAALEPAERLLLRLRFEEELTLSEVARLTGLANPQAADRQIRKVLAKLEEPLRGAAETEPGYSV